VSGLTTATTIWISAAMGMAVGAGEYFIALIGSTIILIVLIVFEKVKLRVERWHQMRTYKISFLSSDQVEAGIKSELDRLHLDFQEKRNHKTRDHYVVVYDIRGKESRLEQFNEFLKKQDHIQSYEY